MSASLKIVAISDTHSLHQDMTIPDGDLLIHAGDFSKQGSIRELEEFNTFLGTLPHRHKVVIAGNHDFCFERTPDEARRRLTHAIYLQDEEIEIEGVRIWGSPWQPWFFDWAFNLQRGSEIREKWDLIPDGIDILVTHGPPHGQRDATIMGDAVGCEELLDVVCRIRPTYHIFGHIHEGYGQSRADGVQFVNASSCNFDYEPIQAPIVLHWPRQEKES